MRTSFFHFVCVTVLYSICLMGMSGCGGSWGTIRKETPSRNAFPAPFVSKWKIQNAGDSITLPLPPGPVYNFTVDWGDGSPVDTITSSVDPDRTHTYSIPKIYTLTISGTLPAWSFNNSGDKDKILKVLDFGDVGWTRLDGAFYGCKNLTVFRGGDTSNVISMENMFRDSPYVVPDIAGWDTKNVTNMNGMFSNAYNANPDISRWNTQSVTNMRDMFSNAIKANPDMSSLDLSNVLDMKTMLLNSNLSDKNYTNLLIQLAETNTNPDINLDVGIARYRTNATSARKRLMMRSWTITDGGININPPVSPLVSSKSFISVWNISAVGESISLPLSPGFNYSFTVDWGDGSSIDVVTSHVDPKRVHTYSKPGVYTLTIDGTLPAWSFNNAGDKDKIIQVLNFGSMGWTNLDNAFHGCRHLKTFRGGDTSNVTSMRAMFKKATYVTPDISGWDTENVTDMSAMFSHAIKANPDVANWDTKNVTNMSEMFSHATNANPNVSKWDTGKVANMGEMFLNALNANPDVSNWNTEHVVDMSFMFAKAYNAKPDVSNWDTGEVVYMNHMFSSAYNVDPYVTDWNTKNVVNMSHMFSTTYQANPNISYWETGKVADMSHMFHNAHNANPDMASLDFSSVTDMKGMFTGGNFSKENYSRFLIQLEETNIKTDITLDVGPTQYEPKAMNARNVLTNTRGWRIADGGPI